jgi:hypothetical protein
MTTPQIYSLETGEAAPSAGSAHNLIKPYEKSLMRHIHWIWILVLVLGITGCGDRIDGTTGLGGSSPEAVVESFIEDLNLALNAPDLADPDARRGWAERLASYFTPSERLDQRNALRSMLNGYADSTRQPAYGTAMLLEISFTRTEVISRDGNQALVDVIDGVFIARWYDAENQVIRERSSSLHDTLSLTTGGIPVRRVGGLWYITEG